MYCMDSLSSDLLLSSSVEKKGKKRVLGLSKKERLMTRRSIALWAVQILSSVLFVKAHVSMA